MARTGRKRKLAVSEREPNGRAHRHGRPQRETAPTQVRRLMDAALADVLDPKWGTELGRLLLTGAITPEMYSAGERWTEAASKYRKAIGIFPIKSTSAEPSPRSHQPDPDSEEGRKLAQREANAAERFFEADAILTQAGPGIRLAVRRLCEDNEICGYDDLVHARAGLIRLVQHWNLTGTSKSGNQRVRNAS